MTNYELLVHKILRCEENARKFINDDFVFEFYRKARIGLIMQLGEMTLEEAGFVITAA